jgi:predicted nucleic acid-binding protein
MPNERTSCFVDTNVLVYTIDPSDEEKRVLARALVRSAMERRTLVLSPQSLNEFYRVVTGHRRLVSRPDARRLIASLSTFCIAPSGFHVTQHAWRIQDATNFSWWDCVLLAAASLARVTYFLSEDLHHHHKLFEMTILNPFRLGPDQQLF